MKIKIFIAFLFTFGIFLTCYAETSKEDVIWYTSFTEAKEIAKKENKRILLLFTGSDWCGACKILEKNVFETKEFKTYAKKNLILLKIDCLKKTNQSIKVKNQQAQLRIKYKQTGFPSSYILDHEGKELGLIKGAKDNFMILLKEIMSKNK